MDYLPTVSKNVITETTNSYILKVNSRDRNIINEPNPFNFKIKFNNVSNKYTTYYETGYFGSGNKWVKNDSPPQSNWEVQGAYYVKTININNGANIEDEFEQIKDIRVSEIVVPRYIPEDKVGYRIPMVEAFANSALHDSVFLKGLDNTNIKYIVDEISDSGVSHNFVEITDVYSKKYYLFKESYMSNSTSSGLSLNLMKNYVLWNNYYTDTIELNCNLYKITDISDNHLILKGNDTPTYIDFIKSDIRLPKYYSDTFWFESSNYMSSSNLNKSLTFSGIGDQSKVIIDASGEALTTLEFAKNTILEFDLYKTTTGKSQYHYFKINSTEFEIDIKGDKKEYTNVSTDYQNKQIILNNLSNSQLSYFNGAINKIVKIDIINTTTGITTGEKNVSVKLNGCNVIITLPSINITEDVKNKNISIRFTIKIKKMFPLLNLNSDEKSEIKDFIIDGWQNSVNNDVKTKVTFCGSWIHGGAIQDEYHIFTTYNNKSIKINLLKAGVRDLLNEKLFYLSLEPITPNKSLITNGKLTNVIGVFYPSTQSKDYIFLTGQNRQKYTNRDLQNLRDITFRLLHMDGTQVGESLKNYSLDYLSLDCKQSNITFVIEQVDKYMM